MFMLINLEFVSMDAKCNVWFKRSVLSVVWYMTLFRFSLMFLFMLIKKYSHKSVYGILNLGSRDKRQICKIFIRIKNQNKCTLSYMYVKTTQQSRLKSENWTQFNMLDWFCTHKKSELLCTYYWGKLNMMC